MLFGDVGSLLSSGPYRAYCGFLWWLTGATTGLTKSSDHPITSFGVPCFGLGVLNKLGNVAGI